MEMDLQIIVRKDREVPVLDLSGEVDAYTSARFREALLDLVDNGSASVIISMENVEYIDSSGLGALVGGLKRVSERSGKIVLVCNNPQIRKVFEITGLEKVFPLYDSEDDATLAIKEG